MILSLSVADAVNHTLVSCDRLCRLEATTIRVRSNAVILWLLKKTINSLMAASMSMRHGLISELADVDKSTSE